MTEFNPSSDSNEIMKKIEELLEFCGIDLKVYRIMSEKFIPETWIPKDMKHYDDPTKMYRENVSHIFESGKIDKDTYENMMLLEIEKEVKYNMIFLHVKSPGVITPYVGKVLYEMENLINERRKDSMGDDLLVMEYEKAVCDRNGGYGGFPEFFGRKKKMI